MVTRRMSGGVAFGGKGRIERWHGHDAEGLGALRLGG
jgi:hypothetical protein